MSLSPTQSLQVASNAMAQGMLRILGFDPASLAPSEWQHQLRAKLVELLRMPPRPCHPKADVVDQVDCGDYVRYRIHLHACDGVILPAYMLQPKHVPPPWPVMLALAGHGPGMIIPVDLPPEGYDRQTMIVEGQRDYAVQAVRQGMLALTPELRGFGELMLSDVQPVNGNTCLHLACRYSQAGRTLMGMRMSDLVQWVDWLANHVDVRKDSICATGNSGGGAAALFLAALDERIRVAVPSCYFCTWADSIMSIHHCPCNYVPDLGFYAECWDIAGLIAPRPMLIVAGDKDEIFPIAGVRKAYACLQDIYETFGAKDNLELYVGDGGHRYYTQPVWPFVREQLARRVTV